MLPDIILETKTKRSLLQIYPIHIWLTEAQPHSYRPTAVIATSPSPIYLSFKNNLEHDKSWQVVRKHTFIELDVVLAASRDQVLMAFASTAALTILAPASNSATTRPTAEVKVCLDNTVCLKKPDR